MDFVIAGWEPTENEVAETIRNCAADRSRYEDAALTHWTPIRVEQPAANGRTGCMWTIFAVEEVSTRRVLCMHGTTPRGKYDARRDHENTPRKGSRLCHGLEAWGRPNAAIHLRAVTSKARDSAFRSLHWKCVEM